MIAFFREGIPSVGEYLMSPVFNLADEFKIALIGALFFGSPMPRWITGSPRWRRSSASSFSRRVGDSAIEAAKELIVKEIHATYAETDFSFMLRLDKPVRHHSHHTRNQSMRWMRRPSHRSVLQCRQERYIFIRYTLIFELFEVS